MQQQQQQQQAGLHNGESSQVASLTANYREEALRLSHFSTSLESWQTAQHLLDQVWSSNESAEEPATVHDNHIIRYGCPECGFELHPGWEGCNLRVRRRQPESRCLRRRVQRQQKRLTLTQQRQAKDSNKRNQKGNGKQQQTQQLLTTELVLLRNDPHLSLDRHCMVVQCGYCEAKIRLKGLKRDTPPTRQVIQKKQQASRGGARVASKKQRTEEKDALSHSDASDGGNDFLTLPPAPASKPKAIISSVGHRRMIPQNPKKKKKKTTGGNNKLMSFLSSLND